ncbi:uncharacterized protein LOC115756115 isoform X1 [Rhodamnia argentea]|uniref:Uncharacterized protein LOC115756115 isoform X1 n=1 Tax=Rhodamnia argentea TaxID=178133 RepID=A0A8B8QWT0_9MYRT|nr:uncharacterized protein LOC115756115 isoform X1 [Rhodamnia argentea]
MLIQALSWSSSPVPLSFLCNSGRNCGLSPFRLFNVRGVNAVAGAYFVRKRNVRRRILAFEQSQSNAGGQRKRDVVEHICLLKAKDNLTDEEEKDMLDYLYTSQYRMGGIVAISLGRIDDYNPERYTHAVFMRFQRKGDLLKFYENPFYLGVLQKHVIPYCHELLNVDYESEVDDDILSIFRKGEEFNYGEEFVLLVELKDDALGELAEDALFSLHRIAMESPSLIVQVSQGLNFNSTSNMEYTHGVVIRFRSIEAFRIFVGSTKYKHIWSSKFLPITRKTLFIHFSIDPVGTELM